MKRLLLLRHAKSDWSTALPDHQRQLNQRGQKAAARMGQYIHDEGLVPDKILCSPATRAAETWRLAQPSLPSAPDAEYIDAIYDCASANALLQIVRQHAGDAQCVMLVGHNPSIEELADLLTADGDPDALDSLARKYPAGALAVIEFETANWQETAPATGNLKRFVRPRALED